MTRDDFEPHEISGLGSTPSESGGGLTSESVSSACAGDGCCAMASDCAIGEVCANGACVAACSAEDMSSCALPLCPGPGCRGDEAASCEDAMRNGREPAVDCGESCPEACPDGSPCHADRDCVSLRCQASRCAAASCEDGALNQDESAVDCGGRCSGCALGQTCRSDADCASGSFCPPASGVCTDASCQNGARDGGEVLTDCGGGACPGCPPGSPCARAEDCASQVCSDGTCRDASCEDGVTSGDESGSDCGGSAPGCPRCGDGEPCRAGSDCASGSCDETCISCSDGIRNGTETGLDCGGAGAGCERCADGEGCRLNADCAGGRCDEGRCAGPRCDDDVQNGTETDTDCGGSAPECSRCAAGERCILDSDCSSQSCDGQLCVSCGDGARNGGESDLDCGGPDPACARCAPGASCQIDSDCSSGACQDGACCGGSQGDCTRCAERLSPSVDCDSPSEGVDPTGVDNCDAFLSCLASSAERCPTRNSPGCSGDDQARDACPHNDYGGNAGTGLTRANQVLANAGCQL